MDERKNKLAEALKNAQLITLGDVEPRRVERIGEDSLDYFMLMSAKHKGWGKRRIEEMRKQGRDVSLFERTLSEFEDLSFPWEEREGLPTLSKILTPPSKIYTTPSKNLTPELKIKEKEERKYKKKDETDALGADDGEEANGRFGGRCPPISQNFSENLQDNGENSGLGAEKATETAFTGAKTGEFGDLVAETGKLPADGENTANFGVSVGFPANTVKFDGSGRGGELKPPQVGAVLNPAQSLTFSDGATFTESAAASGVDFGNVLDAVNGIDIDANAPFPEPFSLRKMLWGKRVAVVGNKTPDKDLSAEIDACDVVIRFNHFYNYESGRVGKRVDVLFITPSSAWLNLKDDSERKIEVIQAQRPLVAFTRFKERAQWKVFQRVFAGLPTYYDVNTNASNNQFTTGVSVLELISQTCENCEVKVFCFGETDAEMWEYFNTQGRHYLKEGYREAIVRERLLKLFPRFAIYTDSPIEEVFPWEAQTDALGRKKLTSNESNDEEKKANED